MTTFLIQPENFDALTPTWQQRLAEKINQALKENLVISPRAEELEGFGIVVVTVATMTPQEYEVYRANGGVWEYISGVAWVAERLLYETDMGSQPDSHRGAA